MYEHYNADNNSSEDIIQVLHSEQWEHASHEDIITNVMKLLADYNILHDDSAKIYVDMSGVAAIRSLKINLGERENYHEVLEFARKNGFKVANLMKVIPISFGSTHKQMLQHMRMLIQSGYVGIDKSYEQLLIGLGSAVEKDLSLDKQASSYSDLIDGLRLALVHYDIL